MADLPSTERSGALALFSFEAGPRYGEELAVPQPVVTVGSGPRSDVVLADDSVSAEHARLEFDAGAWRITDLESTNGTAVEGVRLAPHVPTPLHYGATVRFGGVRMLFREIRGADPAAARESYTAPAAPKTLREERRGFRFPVWLVVLLLALIVLIFVVEATRDTRRETPETHENAPARAPRASPAPPPAMQP